MSIDEAMKVLGDAIKEYKLIERSRELPIGSVENLTDIFASNVRRERQEARLTLGDLAERAGISRTNLQQIETSKINTTIDTIQKIANGLNVDAWVLFMDEED